MSMNSTKKKWMIPTTSPARAPQMKLNLVPVAANAYSMNTQNQMKWTLSRYVSGLLKHNESVSRSEPTNSQSKI
jgi:hypothetical protein